MQHLTFNILKRFFQPCHRLREYTIDPTFNMLLDLKTVQTVFPQETI